MEEDEFSAYVPNSERPEIPEFEGRAKTDQADSLKTPKFDVKKTYTYPTILYRLNPERTARLKEVCEGMGLDPSRVDDHQASVISDMVDKVLPLLRLVGAMRVFFGPLLAGMEKWEQERKRG